MTVSVDDYLWAEDPFGPFGGAACVTGVVGEAPATVLTEFGAIAGARPSRTVTSAESTVGLAAVAGGVVVVEFNGYQGARLEVLTAASGQGRAASAFWNVNAVTLLSLARNGRVLAAFEAETEPADWTGADPAAAADALAPLELDGAHWIASMLAAVQQFTGLQITARDVTDIDKFYPVTPVLDRSPERPAPTRPEWIYDDALNAVHNEALARLLLTAVPQRQREVALWAAQQAAEAVGLADNPSIRDALTGLGSVSPTPVGLAELLRATHRDVQKEARAFTGKVTSRRREVALREHALIALQNALSNPDPTQAVINAVGRAYVIHRLQPTAFLNKLELLLTN